MKALFVTGTDTDVGKTWVSALLAHGFSKYHKTFYHKPIQSGRPTDSDQVRAWLPELAIYPSAYELAMPASPNRAARSEGVEISLLSLMANWQKAPCEGVGIVEGAGGLEVPINDHHCIMDLIKAFSLPTVVVASTRLGTINHTLLTLARMKEQKLTCAGIVLNGPEDPGLKELLEERSQVPVIFSCAQRELLNTETLEEEWRENAHLQSFVTEFLNQELSSKQSSHNTQQLQKLKSWDQEHVWHPFTQHGLIKEHPVVTGAKGSYLEIEGRQVLDGISSWWVNLFGHCHPKINAAIQSQVESLDHVLFAGLSHAPGIELSKKLVDLTRKTGCPMQKVFFSDNGSTAVEVALKMAYQYQRLRGESQRQSFLALKGSYHGDTLGAMSVGARGGFHAHFEPLLFDVHFVDPFDPDALAKVFADYGKSFAAVIFEPLVQGAGGMRMYPPEFLNELYHLAQQHDVLTIADEIFTGFYRTGKLFAFEHTQIRPDLLCLSKGLTAGYLPLSVTLAPEAIFRAFESESLDTAFLHGHSYTANPIAARVACASLDLLMERETQESIKKLIDATREQLERLSQRLPIHQPRQLGTIAAFEVDESHSHYFRGSFSRYFHREALEKGVLLRPLGNTVYTLPPYCTSPDEVAQLYQVIEEILMPGGRR